MAHLFRLPAYRKIHKLGARLGEQVIAQAELGEQAIKGGRVLLQPPIGMDVCDIGALGVQRLRDQQCAMAVQRFLFGAHQRDAVFPHALRQSAQTISETPRPRHLVVANAAVPIARQIIAAAAEFAAKIDVGEVGMASSRHSASRLKWG